MKKIVKLTESQLVEVIKKIVNEQFEDDLDDIDKNFDDDSDEEIQDFGFDYEEGDDETEYSKRKVRHRPISVDFKYSGPEWNKEWEKPYSPIKSSDLPLEKYLASKKKTHQ